MLVNNKTLYKSFCSIALCVISYIGLSSFTYPNQYEVESYISAPVYTEKYTQTDFFRDAYKFRISNKMDVPHHYYALMGAPQCAPALPALAPTPTPIIETAAMRNRKLVPNWILIGILKQETGSYYNEDGEIVYKDRRRSKSGARGPFQIKRICFDEIKEPGEQFSKVEKNMAFAEELAVRYLLYLYDGPAKKNWKTAIGMYYTGPSNYNRLIHCAYNYYEGVKSKGQ